MSVLSQAIEAFSVGKALQPEQVLVHARRLREADETLGRRHRVDRLDPWRVAVAESLFHPAGRERLAVRLGRPASGRSGQREAG